MPSRGRTVALGAVVGFLVAWNWIRLEQPPHAGQAIVIVLLALLPVFGGGLRSRFALAFGAFLLAAGNAFGLGVDMHYPARLASRLWQGFLEFYDVGLPFEAGRHPHMHGDVLVAVFCFTAAAVLAIAAGRTGIAGGALVVGAGWPATLLDGHELVRGSFILAGLLVLLAGMREKPREPSYAVLAGVLVVLVGGVASSSSALAKQGLLNWKAWDFYTHPAKPVDVSYVWSSNYDGLTFPRKRTVVLRITAPDRPQYWRVTALSGVVAGRWREEPVLDRGSARLGEPGLIPPAGNDPSNWVEQKVRVEALQDLHLAAADVPARFEASNLGPVTYDREGIAYLARSLQRGDTYTAWSYEPRPTPGQLARSQPVYPRAISHQRKYLEVDWGSWVPPFGTPGQEKAVQMLFASHYQLAPYLPLYKVARRVAGGARSPYAAAAALESWFRTGGGFIYDQHPPRSSGRPPLVDFVKRTQRGYCQHFAGAMALMLRYLGIPARVAAGFSSGHYHDGVWVVTDHDAHEWVEVWFRGWGWLPFDPTPGRGGGLAGSYSVSSRAFDPIAAALVLGGKDGLSAFENRRQVLGFPQQGPRFFADPRSSRLTPAVSAAGGGGHSSRAPGLVQLLALVLAGLVVVVALLKLAVRRSRYLTRDPRRLAAACRRELRDMLLDQRIDVPSSATLTELADLARAELGVETTAVGRHATVARFGPPASAREAARELRGAMRAARRSLRAELTRLERGRGLLSLRSLGLA